MRDSFNRTIEYLRISLTDRCNFRCLYCMPSTGISPLHHRQILRYEEILRIVSVLTKYGLTRVRLTGGEPLVRRGLVDFVRELSSIPGLDDIAITTNGSLLAPLASPLKNAGLKRVNLSLDTVDAEHFRQLTCGGKLQDTLRGMEAALAVGLTPLKLNVVATTYLTDADLVFFLNLAHNRDIAVRFIEYMPIGTSASSTLGLPIGVLRERISHIASAQLQPATCIGGGPAKYYSLPGMNGLIGFITPISEHFCSSCNRIRLTSDGKIKPCLLANNEYEIKSLMRQGISDESLAELLLQAISMKPSGHTLSENGSDLRRQMSQIGG